MRLADVVQQDLAYAKFGTRSAVLSIGFMRMLRAELRTSVLVAVMNGRSRLTGPAVP